MPSKEEAVFAIDLYARIMKTYATPKAPWWRHRMGFFSALLAFCVGSSPVNGEFPAQRPVTRSFDVFSDQLLNKWLN